MIFSDIVTVLVKAGDGGSGAVSYRREPYVDRGGPDGGDGGKGGNVVFMAETNINTLAAFRHRQLLRAEFGTNGARARRHGKNGEDLVIKVPVGTVVQHKGDTIADLHEPSQKVVVARGGDGGFGNAHFTSSTRQAPNFAEKGEPGDELELTLELKMIADVGLVGLPNAGKSTFLSVVSNARPEIADYPFTTLTPNLGVADLGSDSLLIADIPGLIEGASEGKGLGDEFLRHVERTAVLIHLIDAYSNDIANDYQTIMNELRSYKVDLSTRAMVVAITKIENIDDDILEDQVKSLKKVCSDEKIYLISSVAKKGVDTLLQAVYKKVEEYRAIEKELNPEETIKRVTLDDDFKSWTIHEHEDGIVITGRKIEKFARRTDFASNQAVYRLRDIMKKMGIERELKRRGVEPDTAIFIGRSERYKIKF
jgi:GTP-binding protein